MIWENGIDVNYHMRKESPVQVRCMRQGAWGWCTGMAQRDGMGREVGGAFMCTPVADSCQSMVKPIQYCKVKQINKQKNKSRDITLPTKVRLVKAMVFPVVTYGCECWTIKKAELQRSDAFELWCWRRLLRVPWTARSSNQSILNEISPGVHWKD